MNDGAEWPASEALGDQRDRVLVRSNGTTTYLTNDLAYHRDKIARGGTTSSTSGAPTITVR